MPGPDPLFTCGWPELLNQYARARRSICIYDDDLSVRRDNELAQLLGLDRGRSIADFLFGG